MGALEAVRLADIVSRIPLRVLGGGPWSRCNVMPQRTKRRKAESGGMRQVGCVHSCETCCLSMRVGGHVGGYISVPPWTQIWWVRSWVQDWWVFDPIRIVCFVGAFLLRCPTGCRC